jgi:hypothetical protein
MPNRRTDPNGLGPTTERLANIGRFYTKYGPSGLHSTLSPNLYPKEMELLNSGRLHSGEDDADEADDDWSMQSWCMEQAYYHFGDLSRWKEFIDGIYQAYADDRKFLHGLET